ncbi:MAG: enoyl-CoA hydratase/isomerase family protein [Acidimicrobiales bacterium]|nr:enoyl-CoA hydratase/isomerase family protein [Acidimicrobiales bacterium]
MADERPIEDQIRLDLRGSVAWITIDRPAVGNALNPPCRDRIRDLINELNVSKQARCIVLTAAGEKLFCPGADLSHVYEKDRPEGIPDQVVGDPRRMMLDGQYTLFPAILDSDIPIIAAVNGTAAGMGAHLALACDLVIAADNAKFVEVFARRGLVPDALGPWLLPRIIGVRKTMELMLFAEDLPAADAANLGLVNRVVPATELVAAATEWSERIANGPTLSFGLTKWLVNQSLDTDRATMIHNESIAVEMNTYSEDSKEGIASFRERRAPEWKGY